MVPRPHFMALPIIIRAALALQEALNPDEKDHVNCFAGV